MSAFQSRLPLRPNGPRRGFTLLELIISVALVLVLMLAITKIFSITSTTIGASQGIAAATRDARAAQAVFARDIGAMASDTPFIWIKSAEPFSAFRNTADQAADKDGLPLTIDLDEDGVEGETAVNGERPNGLALSARRHRLDRFSFCARDRFTRQNGNSPLNGNVLVSGLTSSEAWIYYGPLNLPNNNGSFQLNSGGRTVPGDGTGPGDNPNNYYASQWILGRFAPLMILPSGYPTNNRIFEGTRAQEFYATNPAAPAQMKPFTSGTQSTTDGNNTGSTLNPTIRNARYDLVGVDIETAKTIISAYPNTLTQNWRKNFLAENFEVNPFVIKPIDSNSAAQQVPLFVSACSQFVVEFAGDYVEQDVSGILADVNGNGRFTQPDGNIDFVVVNGVKQIKWYGYPRDMNGDNIISAGINSPDVTPISDFALAAGVLYNSASNGYKDIEVFGSAGGTSTKTYTATPGFGIYYAGWGPTENVDLPRPKMYRITMTIDRPEMAGRSADGQTFEYVFTVP